MIATSPFISLCARMKLLLLFIAAWALVEAKPFHRPQKIKVPLKRVPRDPRVVRAEWNELRKAQRTGKWPAIDAKWQVFLFSNFFFFPFPLASSSAG